ncbi:hypothetical protein GS491_26355 [Rhodococcus hoagii]|nr:hypothetical protein [Prescottella equi]NKR80645.1 hypothetical protein [Prescottella equi]NKS99423.1 hypothetical protein [Prescottella equi]
MSSSVERAAEAMSDEELADAIDALHARERRLLIDGNVEQARGVAADKMICLSVQRSRRQRDGHG